MTEALRKRYIRGENVARMPGNTGKHGKGSEAGVVEVRDRELRESEFDREREREFARVFGRYFGCEVVLTSQLSVVDVVAHRDGEVVAVAELRCLGRTYEAFDFVLVDEDKIRSGLEVGELLRVPFLYCVEFSEGGRWYLVVLHSHLTLPRLVTGRSTRVVPAVKVPRGWWRPMG